MFDFPVVALPGLWAALYPAMVWLYGLLNAVSAVCLIALLVLRLSHSETWFRIAVLVIIAGCLGNVCAVLAGVGFTVSATNMAMVIGLAGVTFGMARRAQSGMRPVVPRMARTKASTLRQRV